MSEEIKIKEAALNSVASSIMDITQGLGSESISNLDNMSTSTPTLGVDNLL